MNAILSDVKKNQRRFKYLSKRTDICPLVKHQLSKRVKYYKWMLHRTIQHIKQDMASSKRHQTNAHLELEELQELRKGRIQALQQQKESIERHVHNLEIKIIEMQEKHKKVSVKNYKEIMKGYHEKLVLLQIRLKSVHRRLIQIDKNLANSNTNRHKVLRNTLKHLRQKKARYNKIIAANTAKLNFFKNAIRSAKLTSRKVQLTRKTKKFYTVINANRKLLKDVDMLISTKQTEYDLLSSKIIRHEEDKIKHLLAKLLRIKTSIKKKSNMKSHEKNPKTRTSLKHSIHQLKIKSKTIKNSLNHHQKEIASIRRLFAYYVQKDQYQLMNNELSDASNRIEFLNKKIMVLRNRFARMSKGHNVDFEVPSNHFERAVLALKERIGYNENERKELMKEERKAKKDVGLLNNERSLLLPKVVNETNIFKHKQYLKNMKFTEVKLELAQKEYVHLKHELKHIKRKVAQIKSLLKKPLICKSKGSCPLCLHLGQIMKNGLIKRMNDDMILGKMKRFCSKQKSGLQQMCMESSLKVAQYGFKVSDPYTFDHEQICQKIGMCSL
ncbi:Structural maintenance of chromosomes protein 1A [Entamoeba marina]